MGYIYKPELNLFKCRTLARCLSHCLECDEIDLTEEDSVFVIRFCNSAKEKDFVETALQRLEKKRRDQEESERVENEEKQTELAKQLDEYLAKTNPPLQIRPPKSND